VGSSVIEQHEERILPMSALGERWGCDPRVAARRAQQHGLRIVRWNQRAHGVRLSDVIRLEEQASE
jgi:hypothetical protein